MTDDRALRHGDAQPPWSGFLNYDPQNDDRIAEFNRSYREFADKVREHMQQFAQAQVATLRETDSNFSANVAEFAATSAKLIALERHSLKFLKGPMADALIKCVSVIEEHSPVSIKTSLALDAAIKSQVADQASASVHDAQSRAIDEATRWLSVGTYDPYVRACVAVVAACELPLESFP